jgi:hypothetical protein
MVPSEPVVGKGQTRKRATKPGLTAGRECAMHGVEVDVVYGEYEGLIF